MEFTWVDKESGLTLDLCTTQEILDAMKTFTVRDDDVWIVTYPKSGTTWMQEIVSAVCADGNLESINKKSLDDRIPFIDCVFPYEKRPRYLDFQEMTSRRFIKTHFPQQLIPSGVKIKTPKVIYVARNPKDVVVSYFHFHNAFIVSPKKVKCEEFLQNFIQNTAPWGSWFDHVLYWWKRRHESHVLFVTYEEMKQDLTKVVEQVSKLLGHDLDKTVIDRIVNYCSFENMKKNPQTNKSNDLMMTATVDSSAFMRKGIIGDWKNYFTVEQNEQFNKIYEKRLKSTGLSFNFG